MQLPLVMETSCPICQAPLLGGRDKGHVKACQQIELGLLEDQITPTVEALPSGFSYPEWPRG